MKIRLVSLVAVLVAGCGKDDDPATSADASGTSGSAVSAVSASDSVAPKAPCPRTGRWAICSLEKRLEQAGFVLRHDDGEAPRRSGFSVQPVVYNLGRARLEVFLYPDESALERDLTKMDTTVVAARGDNNDWPVPPRLVRSGNLAAVFLTRNEQQAERVMLTITAGAPAK